MTIINLKKYLAFKQSSFIFLSDIRKNPWAMIDILIAFFTNIK
jgi:hypothetical protein